MAPRSSPAETVVEPGLGGGSQGRGRSEGRALLLWRSVAAPVILAATTVAAVAGAVLALLPAVTRGRPAGRAARPTAPDEASSPASEAASEPLAP